MAEHLSSQAGLLLSDPDAVMSENSSLNVRLFGPFEARIGDVLLPRLRSRRGQWLLALLALRAGRAVERSWLAGTLWPDSTEENALISLRQTLTDLRRALGTERERLSSPTSRTLCFETQGASVDILAFDAALKRGDPSSLREAVRLHHRPLLEDCHEEWAASERDHREQSCLTALLALGDEALALGNPEEAAVFLRRIVTADPYREDARRGLMTALARSGSPGEAVWIYRDLRLRLQRELRTEPSAETRAVYEEIHRKSHHPQKTEQQEKGVSDLTHPAFAAAEKLPRPLTELIGREQDVTEISRRLFRARLVSLVGIGGVGKTRLSIHVAGLWAEDQPDGVAFVDLASLADAGQTTRAVAGALGVQEDAHSPLIDTLSEALRERRFLLILDNCEHLLDACAHLAERLLSECPALVILTTSRQALGVIGEAVWPVSPLALPSETERLSADAVGQVPAVRLFVDRASAVLPGFTCSSQNCDAVVAVCNRLDGVPLALELAAARIRVLTPQQIADRLNDQFSLLTGGSRTALPRQQTLRALIDWSYDLLSETERRLLARCSVFVGGWTLEAAEAVCFEDRQDAYGVLDALTGLVNQSLVQVASENSLEPRYRLLESVRQYAHDRLTGEPDREQIRCRHRDWYAALVQEAQPHLRGSGQLVWLNRFEREHDNLRAAIEQSCQEEQGAIPQLSLAAGLWRFWMGRGYFAEGRKHLAAALERSAGGQIEESLRVKALNGAAAMAWHQGDLPAARTWMEEGLRLARLRGSPTDLETSLNNLGAVVYSQGNFATARPFWEEALAIRRSLGELDGVASSLCNLGYLAHSEGDILRAKALHQEALEMVFGPENKHKRRAPLIGLANIHEATGDPELALTYFEEALALSRDIDDKDCICGSLTGLAKIAARMGEMARSGLMIHEALTVAQVTGMKPAMLGGLEMLIEFFLTSHQPKWAARLWGTVEVQRQQLGLPMLKTDVPQYELLITMVCSLLGKEAADVERAAGGKLRLETAVGWSLERLSDLTVRGHSPSVLSH